MKCLEQCLAQTARSIKINCYYLLLLLYTRKKKTKQNKPSLRKILLCITHRNPASFLYNICIKKLPIWDRSHVKAKAHLWTRSWKQLGTRTIKIIMLLIIDTKNLFYWLKKRWKLCFEPILIWLLLPIKKQKNSYYIY